MQSTRFQKLALAALLSVLLLMFVGATVRVTGAGMGCPDWPTCWGLLIPPTKAEQVDFDRLPVEKFRRKAARMGRDPSTITAVSLRAEFNPRHVWTEFVNRLTSLPVGFLSLATFIASFWQRTKRPLVFWLAFASFLLVLTNAWMGARVVYSGLKPGTITIHLALAMLLLCLLAYCYWAGTDRPRKISLSPAVRIPLKTAVATLLGLLVIEGVLGSQVRELTDELAKAHANSPRSGWISELEQSRSYLFHRSFSWAILIVSAGAFLMVRTHQSGGADRIAKGVFGIVLAQMVLGIIMAQVHIYSWVQVLHVGLAAVLLTLTFLWLLTIPAKKLPDAEASGS